jgi:hypothetical protein
MIWLRERVTSAGNRKVGPDAGEPTCPDLPCEPLVSALIIRKLEPHATLPAGWSPVSTVRHWAHGSPPREHRLSLRLTAEEFGAVAAAAAQVGLTPSGYAGEAAVATALAASGLDEVDAGVSRAELAQVQRDLFAARTALVTAAVALAGVTSPDTAREVASCGSAVVQLDELVGRVHGLLKRLDKQPVCVFMFH